MLRASLVEEWDTMIDAFMASPCNACVSIRPGQQTAVLAPGQGMRIDSTTPAGATREGALISAIERGWTEPEIAAGTRFHGQQTFVCPGCRRELPLSMAMSASMGRCCDECYDEFS